MGEEEDKKKDWKPKDGAKQPIIKMLMEFEEEVFDPWFIKRVAKDTYYNAELETGLGFLFRVIFVNDEELEFKYDFENERDEQLAEFKLKAEQFKVFVI